MRAELLSLTYSLVNSLNHETHKSMNGILLITNNHEIWMSEKCFHWWSDLFHSNIRFRQGKHILAEPNDPKAEP